MSCIVIGGGHIGAGQAADCVEKILPIGATGDITPIKKEIASIVQCAAPAGHCVSVLLESGAVQQGVAQVDLPVRSVGNDMHGCQV
jgi:hypothetical protein